jgi:hypothetical protein
MRIKLFFRRFMYITLFLLAIWVICVQAGCLAMRTPDKKWAEELHKKGQQAAVQFIDVPNGRGRNLHTVSIASSDTLPWVLFAHGSPGASDAFIEYLADTVLTRHFNLIAFDRAGFGYSGFGHPETTLAGQAADMKANSEQCEHLSPPSLECLVLWRGRCLLLASAKAVHKPHCRWWHQSSLPPPS